MTTSTISAIFALSNHGSRCFAGGLELDVGWAAAWTTRKRYRP